MSREIKTEAFVLRRTNIGEADRLLDLLTREGRVTVKARSVRKEKSRLAGGVEMFCLSLVGIHQSEKTGHNILTFAKMQKFYQNILGDISRLEVASDIIREIGRATNHIDGAGYFDLVRQCFEALDQKQPPDVVFGWFLFNSAILLGEQINLMTDVDGGRLDAKCSYVWDSTEAALRPLAQGRVGVNEIKIMRIMISSPLALALKVEGISGYMEEILHIAKSVNQRAK